MDHTEQEREHGITITSAATTCHWAVEVTTPDSATGEVIGDLNARRGHIQAMDERAGARVIRALVPLSEMFGYVSDLRCRTSGRGSHSMQFDSYAEVPRGLTEAIIAKA
jgi:elongation factor G